jgi:hypothetical protein
MNPGYGMARPGRFTMDDAEQVYVGVEELKKKHAQVRGAPERA